MESLIKVECTLCEGRYYLAANDLDILLPRDIQPGEAFPNICPFCEEGSHAVLIGEA